MQMSDPSDIVHDSSQLAHHSQVCTALQDYSFRVLPKLYGAFVLLNYGAMEGTQMIPSDLQLPMWQWGTRDVYLLVLPKAKM